MSGHVGRGGVLSRVDYYEQEKVGSGCARHTITGLLFALMTFSRTTVCTSLLTAKHRKSTALCSRKIRTKIYTVLTCEAKILR